MLPDNLKREPPVDLARPLRVLRVLTRANLGGPTRQAIALWHAHQDLGHQTLLVTGKVAAEEVELSPLHHGVPRASADGCSSGWLELPSMRRGIDVFGDRRARRQLRLLMRAFRPDVVHTHTSKAGYLGRTAAWLERVPVVAHTFHGHVLKDYFAKLPSKVLAMLERRLARRTNLLFAISPSCADELAACRVAVRERFVITAPAVPMPETMSRAAARARLGIAPHSWQVCAVGRLVPIKRLADFVHTVAADAELNGDILGDGPELQALQQLAQQHASGRVRLRGAEPDIASLLPAYDAVVLPSFREGCPLVAIEAFAAGVPVVGYDVPGVRDALSHFGRGILVPEQDGPVGLLRALRELRADPTMQARMTKLAQGAVAGCRPAVVAEGLLSAYRDAAAQMRR